MEVKTASLLIIAAAVVAFVGLAMIVDHFVKDTWFARLVIPGTAVPLVVIIFLSTHIIFSTKKCNKEENYERVNMELYQKIK